MLSTAYPRACFIGDTGDGKTLSMTAVALAYASEGKKIFSNYNLKGVPYTYLEAKDIPALMFQEDSPLHDCVILTDEIHMDFSKFSFLRKETKESVEFASQTRKRRIIWLYSTQVFGQLVKGLRDLTTYIIYCRPLGNDFYKFEIYDRISDNNGFIKCIQYDGKEVYDYYDHEEIIHKTIKKE